MTKLRMLLFGGSGFIGRHIHEHFADEYIVYAPTHADLELTDSHALMKYLAQHPVDIVIHAANIGGTKRDCHLTNVVSTNLRIFFNLVRCHKYYQRMIFLGSGAEYDKRRDLIRVKEEDFGKHVPVDDYGFSKYVCSQFIEKANNMLNLRIFGCFGKHEDYETRFISNAICHAILNLPIIMSQNAVFDYLYVNDLMRIIEHFVKHKPKETCYNAGTGQPVDLLSIAQIVKKISGKDLEIRVKSSGLNKEYSCDNSRLLREIPNLQFTPLEQAISELYEWYSNNRDKWDRNLVAQDV